MGRLGATVALALCAVVAVGGAHDALRAPALATAGLGGGDGDGEASEELWREARQQLGEALLLPLLILFTFVGLAVVCDDYLAPSLEALVARYDIPHDVASATFLALGSSAPEISINCVATAHGKVSMSLGAVLGSGIIAYTVIPAACVLVSKGQVLRLETVPLLRDVSFYAVSILAFVAFTFEGSFSAAKDAALVAFFAVYLAAMLALGKLYHAPAEPSAEPSAEPEGEGHSPGRGRPGRSPTNGVRGAQTDFRRNCAREDEEEEEEDEEEAPLLNGLDAIDAFKGERERERDSGKRPKGIARYKTMPEAGSARPAQAQVDKAERALQAEEALRELESAESCVASCVGLASAPLHALFHCTIPPLCNHGDEAAAARWWPATMLVSLAYVCALSEVVLLLTTRFANTVGLPHNIAGMTILALGAQVPDLFASVAVAKQGQGPSSIANAVGSQIINILVGIGGPFLLFNLHTGQAVHIGGGGKRGNSDGEALALAGALLFGLVLVFLVLCFRHVQRSSPIGVFQKPALTSTDAVVLAALYVVTMLVLVQVQVSDANT